MPALREIRTVGDAAPGDVVELGSVGDDPTSLAAGAVVRIAWHATWRGAPDTTLVRVRRFGGEGDDAGGGNTWSDPTPIRATTPVVKVIERRAQAAAAQGARAGDDGVDPLLRGTRKNT